VNKSCSLLLVFVFRCSAIAMAVNLFLYTQCAFSRSIDSLVNW